MAGGLLATQLAGVHEGTGEVLALNMIPDVCLGAVGEPSAEGAQVLASDGVLGGVLQQVRGLQTWTEKNLIRGNVRKKIVYLWTLSKLRLTTLPPTLFLTKF